MRKIIRKMVNGENILGCLRKLDNDGHHQCLLSHGSMFSKYVIDDLLASCPACAFGIRRKALEESLSWDEKASYQRLWLKHCLSNETGYIFQIFKEYNPEIDRERDVYEIIKKGLKKDEMPLAKLIGAKKGVSHYKNVLTNWFLKRYNWKNAFELLLKGENAFLPVSIAMLVTLLPLAMLVCLTAGNINLKPSLIKHPLLMTQYQITEDASRKVNPELKDILSGAAFGLPTYIEIVGLIFLIIVLALFFHRKYTNFIFPRFLGANFIGILPLVTQDSTWTFPLRLNWGQIYLFSLPSLIVAFIYLTVECRKATELHLWDVMKRTLPITFYGFLISLSLSLVFCDALAIHFLDYSRILYDISYKGIFGLLYPKVIVLFASFSFLTGIFVQIFWEEKTVTEPL